MKGASVVRALVASCLLPLGAADCGERPFLEVFLIPSEKPEDPDGEGDGPDPPAPRFRACPECVVREVTLATGERLSVTTSRVPQLRVGRNEVVRIELLETPGPPGSDGRRWIAVARLAPAAAARAGALARAFPGDRALIELEGWATDVNSPASWAGGVRVAAFEERGDLERFAWRLDIPTEWASPEAGPGAREADPFEGLPAP